MWFVSVLRLKNKWRLQKRGGRYLRFIAVELYSQCVQHYFPECL